MDLAISEYTEQANAIIDATNFALIELSQSFPLEDIYSITQAESAEEGYTQYDLQTLVGASIFDGFSDTPVYKADDNNFMAVTDFRILADRYLYLLTANDGDFKVVYKKKLTKITTSTADTFAMELRTEVNNLIPLRVAHIVLSSSGSEQEVNKGIDCFNEYQNALETLRNKRKIRKGITISEGDYVGV